MRSPVHVFQEQPFRGNSIRIGLFSSTYRFPFQRYPGQRARCYTEQRQEGGQSRQHPVLHTMRNDGRTILLQEKYLFVVVHEHLGGRSDDTETCQIVPRTCPIQFIDMREMA